MLSLKRLQNITENLIGSQLDENQSVHSKQQLSDAHSANVLIENFNVNFHKHKSLLFIHALPEHRTFQKRNVFQLWKIQYTRTALLNSIYLRATNKLFVFKTSNPVYKCIVQ